MNEPVKRSRGRPRKYDHDTALSKAMTVFWLQGIEGTSYDDLVDAMGMNRPSIYRAFGNKDAVYRQALELFGNSVLAQLEALHQSAETLRVDLERFVDQALDAYCGDSQPMGCFIACTAVADSTIHPEIQPDLLGYIQAIDKGFEQRCLRAQMEGDLNSDVDAKLVAQSVQGLLHTLAVRARAGQSRRALNKLKQFQIVGLCSGK